MINGKLEQEDLRSIAKVGIVNWCRTQMPPMEVADITQQMAELAMATVKVGHDRPRLIAQLRFGCPFKWGTPIGEYDVPQAERVMQKAADDLEWLHERLCELAEESEENACYIIKSLKELVSG